MGKQRDQLLKLCEQLEKVSGKQKDKWDRTKHDRRMRYLRHVFADDRFKGSLRYSVFRQTSDYDTATVEAIVKALSWKKPTSKFTTFIYVDGLSKKKRHEYGVRLRRLGMPVRQVRGIARDESNALTRLADAVAGFVRDVLEAEAPEMKTLFEDATHDGILVEV